MAITPWNRLLSCRTVEESLESICVELLLSGWGQGVMLDLGLDLQGQAGPMLPKEAGCRSEAMGLFLMKQKSWIFFFCVRKPS